MACSQRLQGWGAFDAGHPAGYRITSPDPPSSWEYIYQNRDILLRVDQHGPVSAQAYPPRDIVLFRRESRESFSPWLVWMRCGGVNGGLPFTNFFCPAASGNPARKPESFQILFQPHQAEYEFLVDGLWVRTVFFVPPHGAEIFMELQLENRSGAPLELALFPTLVPYVNPAQLAPWDKPEWYLKSGLARENGRSVFWSQLLNPSGILENRRTAVLWSDADDAGGYEISLEKFTGCGAPANPQAVYGGTLRIPPSAAGARYGEYTDAGTLCGYPPVYAAAHSRTLRPGQSAVFRQVLTMPAGAADGALAPPESAGRALRLFDPLVLEQEKRQRREYFEKLLSVRSIQTADPQLDRYVNEWLPLQMDWVASLDRGWPTGMRGARDCANDFMGEVYLNGAWSREILLLLMECQRSDGWFPRQVSTAGRGGKHDLREFVDGGAFFVEFLHEYLCVSGDFSILEQAVPWLDDDAPSPVWEHCRRSAAYYLLPENLGEHGLCKIRGGDWLDAVNQAGLRGRGESVMVTCQAVMAITWLCQIMRELPHVPFDFSEWEAKAKALRQTIRTAAYNEKGFFNGDFTDDGTWLFSDRDPDGQCRPYVCANAYAVCCGAAEPEMLPGVLDALASLKGRFGYRLFSPPLGTPPLRCVGRLGTGDAPAGLFENGTPYNHGSHGFLARCFAALNQPDALLDALYYMLPYDQARHPSESALTPPYAMVNCWQDLPGFRGRGGMLFLTGSIAMALRAVYQWMLGIRFEPHGLQLRPCLSRALGTVQVQFPVRGRRVFLELRHGGREELTVSGSAWTQTRPDVLDGVQCPYLPYEMLSDGCRIVYTLCPESDARA